MKRIEKYIEQAENIANTLAETANFTLDERVRLNSSLQKYTKLWPDQEERVTRYFNEYILPRMQEKQPVIRDVFEEDVKKRTLLKQFYDYDGDENLECCIDNAIEEYPDENDFDLRYYYVKEQLGE